jgi:hypothetical protein
MTIVHRADNLKFPWVQEDSHYYTALETPEGHELVVILNNADEATATVAVEGGYYSCSADVHMHYDELVDTFAKAEGVYQKILGAWIALSQEVKS